MPVIAPGAAGVVALVIITLSHKLAHPGLEIVHLNELEPLARPVTPDDGLAGVVTVPPPLNTVHAPVPEAGVFPARVAVETQYTI